jgi:hypothetical protein
VDGKDIVKAYLAFKEANPETFDGQTSGIWQKPTRNG